MTTTDERPADTAATDEPEPDKRLLAGRQIVAGLLAAEVAQLVADERATLEPLLRPRESVVATLPDGTEIGKVGRTKPVTTARVTNEKELLAWVQKNRPDEIVHSVRESYLRTLKDQAKKHGHAFDPATGEVIPGIEQMEGSSSYRPEADEDARDIVLPQLLDLLANGLMPQLPVGRDDS